MGRHVRRTHVTLEVGDLSLHVDAEKANWYKTDTLERAYSVTNQFNKVDSVYIGETTVPGIPIPTSRMVSYETILWWYGFRWMFPDWRPNGCVKEVRAAAAYYGWELPDTAVTDELFISSEDYKCK